MEPSHHRKLQKDIPLYSWLAGIHNTARETNARITNRQDKILKAVTSELEGEQRYKFAINSTIVQHSVPTAAPTYASTGTSTTDNSTAVSNTEKKKAATGRRGMHSATGGYWNQATDGMWSYKYEGGDDKGFDVVIMLIWIGF